MAAIADKAVRWVRSRETHPIHVTLDTEGGKQERVTLNPNERVKVSERVYDMLKAKFGVVGDRLVPDHDENERNPHGRGQAPAMRAERRPGYIIDGLDD